MALGRKYALITGSSRGIGRGIALALAENGVKVAIHYNQNEAAAKDTLAQVRERGSDGLLVQADVTDPAQITDIFRKLKNEFGKLDIFVSNAPCHIAIALYCVRALCSFCRSLPKYLRYLSLSCGFFSHVSSSATSPWIFSTLRVTASRCSLS